MRRGIMSAMVVLITIISVIIMLYSSGSMTFNLSKVYEIKESASNNIRAFSNSLLANGSLISRYFNNISLKGDINDEISNNANEDITPETSVAENVSEVNESSMPNNDMQKYENIAIFKMPREEIEEKLSSEERAELLSVVGKISPVDYLKIEGYLKSKDSETAVVNSISLLKIRLSKKDYEKLKEVASKYIEMERIEEILAS